MIPNTSPTPTSASKLWLEAPFYSTEAIERYVRPLLPGASVCFDVSALASSDFCEALNAALRHSVENYDAGT